MVAIVLIHMVQVFLFGAYKFPRELTWIIGVLLLLMTLGMAFTGQVLRFDQDAYWGLGIGASITSRTPILGATLVKLILGGPIIAGATLSRARGAKGNLRKAISRINEERRGAICSLCRVERHVFRGNRPTCYRRLRCVLRAVRPDGPTRPYDYPDGAQA